MKCVLDDLQLKTIAYHAARMFEAKQQTHHACAILEACIGKEQAAIIFQEAHDFIARQREAFEIAKGLNTGK